MYLSSKSSSLDQFLGILIFLIWMAFNVYRATQKAKAKKLESANPPAETRQEPEVKEEKSFREIMEEIRRAAEAAKKKEVPRQPAPVKQVRPVKQVKTESVSERERKKQLAYERFVEAERKAEHDASVRNLDEKIMRTVDTSDRKPVVVNVNLRNIIIADAILNRPYK